MDKKRDFSNANRYLYKISLIFITFTGLEINNKLMNLFIFIKYKNIRKLLMTCHLTSFVASIRYFTS